MTRVMITGAGLQGGLGDLMHTWQGLCEGRSALKVCHPDGANYPLILGAPALEFDLNAYLADRKAVKYMNRVTALTVAAAGMALEDAGLLNHECCRDMALFISTGLISFDLSRVTPAVNASITADKKLDLKKMGSEGLALCNPLMPFKMLLNTPLGMVSIIFGIGGDNFILYPGADQGGVALESAVQGIRSGRFQRALVGGGVQGLGLLPIATLDRLGRVARPTGKKQTGWAPCDAAAFVVLESEAAAAARGAGSMGQVSSVTVLHGHHQDPDDLEQSLIESAGDHIPDGILVTGRLEEEDDIRIQNVCDRLWPSDTPRIVSFDSCLGYAGAASLPCLSALAVCWLDRGYAPSRTKKPQNLIVYSGAPEESLVAVRLQKHEVRL